MFSGFEEFSANNTEKLAGSPVVRFAEYSLTEILPSTRKIIIDRQMHIILLCDIKEDNKLHLIEAEHFPSVEYDMLVALLENFPYYCPREKLLSVLTRKPLERCQTAISNAEQAGDVTSVMRNVVNAVSRTRTRLEPFGIDITAIVETGYILTPLHKNFKKSHTNLP